MEFITFKSQYKHILTVNHPYLYSCVCVAHHRYQGIEHNSYNNHHVYGIQSHTNALREQQAVVVSEVLQVGKIKQGPEQNTQCAGEAVRKVYQKTRR